MNNIDWRRVGLFLAISTSSALVGWWGQPFIHGNDEARGVIVNVFSILAGFLITVMTLLGEPGLFRGRTWRSDAVKRTNFYRRLVRHKWLFISYLIVLALVFLTSIVAKLDPEGRIVMILEGFFLGFATFAFIYSLLLPSQLLNLQLTRFDEWVESRRHAHKSES
ncbi:MAG: hypothetical protein AB1831_10685 [Pseudomonadota bacterium]